MTHPMLRLVALATYLLAGAATAVAGATETQEGWRLRFYAASVDFEEDSSQAHGAPYTRFDADAGGAVGINAEYRFSRRLGVDFGLFAGASVDVQTATYCGTFCAGSSWIGVDTLTFAPFITGLDVHLTPDHRADVYAGPLVAWVRYGDIVVLGGAGPEWTTVDFDEQLAGGLVLGVGVPFGNSRWTFDARLLYLDSALDGRGPGGYRIERDYDSTIFGLGFGYRFGS